MFSLWSLLVLSSSICEATETEEQQTIILILYYVDSGDLPFANWSKTFYIVLFTLLSTWLDVLTAFFPREILCCCIMCWCVTSSLYLLILFLRWTSCAVPFIVFLTEKYIIQVYSYYCKASYSNNTNGNRVTEYFLQHFIVYFQRSLASYRVSL